MALCLLALAFTFVPSNPTPPTSSRPLPARSSAPVQRALPAWPDGSCGSPKWCGSSERCPLPAHETRCPLSGVAGCAGTEQAHAVSSTSGAGEPFDGSLPFFVWVTECATLHFENQALARFVLTHLP